MYVLRALYPFLFSVSAARIGMIFSKNEKNTFSTPNKFCTIRTMPIATGPRIKPEPTINKFPDDHCNKLDQKRNLPNFQCYLNNFKASAKELGRRFKNNNPTIDEIANKIVVLSIVVVKFNIDNSYNT